MEKRKRQKRREETTGAIPGFWMVVVRILLLSEGTWMK